MSGISCLALSSMVLRCSGLGVRSFRHGIALGTTLTVGDDGFEDFFREFPSSASVDSLAVAVVWIGERCLDGAIDGELGLSVALSIADGRTGVLVRSESDDLVMAAASSESGESEGRRM